MAVEGREARATVVVEIGVRARDGETSCVPVLLPSLVESDSSYRRWLVGYAQQFVPRGTRGIFGLR